MLNQLLSSLPGNSKYRLRSLYYSIRKRAVQTFLSYGPEQLKKALHSLGLRSGDTLMMHSSFGPSCGFNGAPGQLIDAILEFLGPEGNLLMVSLPYRSSTYEYLESIKVFDVRKTVSYMGLISETFRRRPGVSRSLHPTHPVLAYGPKAEWMTANHENCLFPCGPGTPFEKLATANGKALFFDAPLVTFTFFHYLEDSIKDRLPFPLYFEKPFQVSVIDHNGKPRTVRTCVFSMEANQRRRPEIFWNQMNKRGAVKTERIGNSTLHLVEVTEAILCTQEMLSREIFFYDLGRRLPAQVTPFT